MAKQSQSSSFSPEGEVVILPGDYVEQVTSKIEGDTDVSATGTPKAQSAWLCMNLWFSIPPHFGQKPKLPFLEPQHLATGEREIRGPPRFCALCDGTSFRGVRCECRFRTWLACIEFCAASWIQRLVERLRSASCEAPFSCPSALPERWSKSQRSARQRDSRPPSDSAG